MGYKNVGAVSIEWACATLFRDEQPATNLITKSPLAVRLCLGNLFSLNDESNVEAMIKSNLSQGRTFFDIGAHASWLTSLNLLSNMCFPYGETE
jgi:hypothetical protein